MSIPVSKIVRVGLNDSPTFPARKGFGLLNIIGTSVNLPIGDRIRFYSDMTGVAADFSTTDGEYKAAQIFFSQSPRPTELAISRRFDVAVPGELLGSVGYELDLAVWQAVTNGGFDITIDGGLEQITALSFAAAANLNSVASIIQVALNAAATGATCTFNGTRFVIKSGTTGVDSTVSFTVPPTGAGTPTDIGAMLGTRAVDLGISTAGAAIETVTETLDQLQDINQSWYGFGFSDTLSDANIKLAAAWAETQTKIYGFTTSASNVLDGASTADIGYFLKANLYRRTFATWDLNDQYQWASVFARAFTVNFEGQNTTITLKFKLLPGTTPNIINESQRLSLVSKNVNYYTYFGDSAMLAEGVMVGGKFFDEVHGLDWQINDVETEVFGYLYTRPTKVPQTDKGVASIVQRVEKSLARGVNNGLLAPGYWNGADLGEIVSGDFLPRGFYVYAQKVADQAQTDREARKAPPIQAILKGAGAIHFVDITLTFER